MPARRVRWRVGDVVSVPLGTEGSGFGLVLEEPLIAFFDLLAQEAPPVGEIASRPVLFQIWVMTHAVTRGTWPVIGHVEVPSHLVERPWFFKEDRFTHQFTMVRDHDEIPSDAETCSKLERAAVWDAAHVASRLSDHFAGRPNMWAESLRPGGQRTPGR
jgi:hypothetical protein